MSNEHIRLGQYGELIARLFYEMHDVEVREVNWKCVFGEVDLIVRDEDCLVFCEVKTRRSVKSGIPEESVDRKKQERYIRCAQHYVREHGLYDRRIRFDVIAVYTQDTHEGKLRFIPNAFGEDT